MLTSIDYYENLVTVLQMMSKSYCSTVYCSSMWFVRTVTSMKKLKIAYNNGIEKGNLPKYDNASKIIVNLNILFFNEQLQKSVFSFGKRISKLDSLVHSIVTSPAPLFS